MANLPMNIWLIKENEFDSFTFTGGKVIYIAEEPNPIFRNHPAIITAGALLPPVEAIQLELDGSIGQSGVVYEQYLLSEVADQYITVLLAAAFQQVPIAIMFGKDELNMRFPAFFINFLYQYYGLVIGVKGSVNPCIMETMIPADMAKLYNMDMIDYKTFMEKHPPMQIHPAVISKMAYEQRPIVANKEFNDYFEYFEHTRKVIYENGGRFLIDPMEAI